MFSFNQKDSPESVLQQYAVEVIHPDDFICYQLDLSPTRVCAAIKQQRVKQRAALRNPPKSREEFLAILQKQQLPHTCLVLKRYIEFI